MKLWLIIAACTLYTFIRYAVFGDVGYDHWPAFLINKALSFSALGALCVSAWHYGKAQFDNSKRWGQAVWHLTLIHIGLSMILLSPDYYPKFYLETGSDHDGLNITGELLLFAGVLATYCFWRIPTLANQTNLQQQIKLLAIVLIGCHLLPMSNNWIDMTRWHGSLPPISLLSFLLCVIAWGLFQWRSDSQNKSDS